MFKDIRADLLISMTENLQELAQGQLHTSDAINEVSDKCVCYICRVIICSKRKYRKHLAKSHQKPAFQCPSCTESFESKKLLKVHCRLNCTGKSILKRKFACAFCPMEFSKSSAFYYHNQIEHCFCTDEQENQCENCRKCFSHDLDLQHHQKSCLEPCGKQKRKDQDSLNENLLELSEQPMRGCDLLPEHLHSSSDQQRYTLSDHLHGSSDQQKHMLSDHLHSSSDQQRHTLSDSLHSSSDHLVEDNTFAGKIHGLSEQIQSPEFLSENITTLYELSEQQRLQTNTTNEDLRKCVCYICKTVISNTKKYKKHLAKSHQKLAFQCSSCNDSFASKKLLSVHYSLNCVGKSVLKRKYLCTLCPMKFSKSSAFNHHNQREHCANEVEQKNQCKKCKKYFSHDQNNLQHHQNQCQGPNGQCKMTNIDLPILEHGLLEQQPQSELVSPVSLVCYICQSVMPTQHKYKKHLAKLHNKPVFQCNYCSHGCLSRKILKFHRQSVCKSESLASRSYKCKLCPMTYSYRPALSRHRMSEHRSDDSKQKNVCKICQKSFSRRIYLQEHVSRCQKREGMEIVREKHLCDKCQKEYASVSSLNYHIRTIHDKKLFFCQCGKHFRWSRYLYIHMKTSCQYVSLSGDNINK